jgi:predicted MFS family arabinose efflux permease
LTGIGEATCAPIGPTLIADCFARSQRSRALAILFMAIPIGAGLGLGLGAQAIAWLDWRWAFYVTGTLGALAAGLALTIREPRQEIEAPSRAAVVSSILRDWADLLKNRPFVLTTLGMAFMVFALIGLNFWSPTFLATVRNVPVEDAGTWLGLLVGVTGIGGAALGGWLGDRLIHRGSRALAWLIAACTLGAVPFLALALWVAQPVFILAFLTLGLTLVCMNVGPLDTLLINVTAPRIRGAAFSLNVLAIHLLGEMPAPYVLGRISDQTGSLQLALAFAVAALVGSGIVYGLIVPFTPTQTERPSSESRPI